MNTLLSRVATPVLARPMSLRAATRAVEPGRHGNDWRSSVIPTLAWICFGILTLGLTPVAMAEVDAAAVAKASDAVAAKPAAVVVTPVAETTAAESPAPKAAAPEEAATETPSEEMASADAAESPKPTEAPAVGKSPAKARLLFDGKSLAGWTNPYEWGTVEVVEGEIHLTADKKFFLMTEQEFYDYEFEGEVKLPEGVSNSGFMARGQVEPNNVFGYQAEADPTDRRWSGGLYDERRRQWLNPLWKASEAQDAFDRNRWNRYRIRCVGHHLQFFVNDVPTTDYFDPVDLHGRIGIQHHGEKGQTYRFRNMTVKELGRHEWKPLFNSDIAKQEVPEGEVIPGFRSVGGGAWTVVDGILQGRASSEANEPNGLLYSTKQYTDGTYRIVYRFHKGDSGLFVRSAITDSKPFIKGVQCEVDGSDQVGGLYQTGGKGWVAQPLNYLEANFPPDRRDVVRKNWEKARQGLSLGDKLKPDASDAKEPASIEEAPWQTMVVNVKGKRVVTHLNNCLAADCVIDDLADSGVIALQLHGNQDMEIDFKSIEILQPAK
ncbi:3-keto-disaccharide hydrolase [Neorhodopirellula lusitana]|uniref:3-keto-disaccharide hydrolase n=1 Tax=Neorhodopirellula lusitana TaxID=445327 RepID=UPI00384B4993